MSVDIPHNTDFKRGHCLDGFWVDVTRLGESGLLMPIGALLFLWFLFASSRVALVWTIAFGLGVVIVIASKIAFIGWGIGIRPLDFTGFSGHTMLAAAIYPSVGWFSVPSHRPRVRVAVTTIGFLFAALVGVSRLEVRAHSSSEVVAGFVLGASVAVTLIGVCGRRPIRVIPIWPLAVAFVAFNLIGIGKYAPSHQIIAKLALAASGHDQPYRRAQWLRNPQGSSANEGVF
jgi:membrane-associated phospholipid phosphatase